MRILSIPDMRTLESEADAAGHTYAEMMDLAGKSVAGIVEKWMPAAEKRVLVLVGPGNNGGDGLVAARILRESGADVTAYLTRPRDPDADPVFQAAQAAGTVIVLAQDDPHGDTVRALVASTGVIVDALLGIGATPPVRGTIASVLKHVNAALATRREPSYTTLKPVAGSTPKKPVIVAVDGPSGLDFESGDIDAAALKADVTVTFAGPKWGHFRFPGAAYTGEPVVADIGIPESVNLPGDGVCVATPATIREWLPARPPDAHKGTFGKALIVAGSINYTGAAGLAASAAVRTGAGLVTLAIPSVLHGAIVPLVPEATYLLLAHTQGVLDARATGPLEEVVSGYSALLIGPGLSHTPETTAFLQQFLGRTWKKRNAGFRRDTSPSVEKNVAALPPLVIDADGLNILSATPDWTQLLPPETILTPHPGEMARLTGRSTPDVQANRVESACENANAWNSVVVLKGAFTVIAAPDGRTMLLPFANPALASAGTGDVLAGAIIALRAQGLGAFEAAVCGAYLHGLAGDIVREQRGTLGLAARDVAEGLAAASKKLL